MRVHIFYVYFVLLVSNCIRYGLVMSLYIAVLVNVLYTITLSLGPDELRPTRAGWRGSEDISFLGRGTLWRLGLGTYPPSHLRNSSL